MTILEFIRSNQPYFEDFITRNVYHSNGIEGNTLSMAETYAIIFNDNSFKVTAAPREIYEAINLKYALSYMMDHCMEPLSQGFIKHIGVLINHNINEIDGFRRVQVFIKGAEHIPPAPNMVHTQMMQFIYNYDHTVFSSPYERAAQAHVEFERIHPFPDGNGRTGRILINYEMLGNDLAPIVIPVDRRAEYFNMLASCDVPSLTSFFRELSEEERERIQQFGMDFQQAPPEQEP